MRKGRTLVTTLAITAAVFSSLSLPTASAAPVVNSVTFFTDRFAPNTVPGFLGPLRNTTQWNVNVTSTGACAGVTGTFFRGSSGPFTLNLISDPIFSNCLFSRNSTPLSASDLLAFAGSTDPWSFTMTDSSGSITGFFPLIANPQLLPFATDIGVSDSSATPLVFWSLPDLTGFDVDSIRLRVIESTGLQVFESALLAANATSFQLPDGVLQADRSYFYRVMLQDVETSGMENRSNAFSAVAFQVPEPGTLALLGLGLAGLAATRRRKQ